MATQTHGYGEVVPPEYSGEGHIHHPPVSTYLITYVLLLVLLFITVGAYYVDLNRMLHVNFMNILVAMVIAIVKAALVVLFFMNVKGSTRLTWLWASIGFIWLLLMAGILIDYMSRSWLPSTGWQ